jgi:hypothetical protein
MEGLLVKKDDPWSWPLHPLNGATVADVDREYTKFNIDNPRKHLDVMVNGDFISEVCVPRRSKTTVHQFTSTVDNPVAVWMTGILNAHHHLRRGLLQGQVVMVPFCYHNHAMVAVVYPGGPGVPSFWTVWDALAENSHALESWGQSMSHFNGVYLLLSQGHAVIDVDGRRYEYKHMPRRDRSIQNTFPQHSRGYCRMWLGLVLNVAMVMQIWDLDWVADQVQQSAYRLFKPYFPLFVRLVMRHLKPIYTGCMAPPGWFRP